jgi:hypothetical protein
VPPPAPPFFSEKRAYGKLRSRPKIPTGNVRHQAVKRRPRLRICLRRSGDSNVTTSLDDSLFPPRQSAWIDTSEVGCLVDAFGARPRAPTPPSKLAKSAARRNIIEHVKIDLDEDEIRRLIDALTITRLICTRSRGNRRRFRELLLGPACSKESRSRERNSVQIATHRGIDVSEM